MKTIQLICATCNNEFTKIFREYKRRLKEGHTRFFCSRSCACLKNNEEHPRKGNYQLLISNNRRDQYTPFRWFILRAEYRDRNKGYGCDLSAEYLKQLWDEQDGICPLTGLNLILPVNTRMGFIESNPNNASIDRIDNSKGYLQGNVRFVSVMANLARQSFSDEQLIDFCKAVVKFKDDVATSK